MTSRESTLANHAWENKIFLKVVASYFCFFVVSVSDSINTKKNLKVDARAKLAYEIFEGLSHMSKN